MAIALKPVKEANFAYLLGGLALTTAGATMMREFGLDTLNNGMLVSMLMTVTIFISTWTLVTSRLWFFVGIGLVALSVITDLLFAANPNALTLFFSMGVLLVFCMLSAAFVVGHLFRGDIVSFNHLLGAICLYLLLGLIWAILYAFCFIFLEGSFRGVAPLTEENGLNAVFSDLSYFSYVTLTTLGYGDVTPVRPVAKALAILEAVTGMFYIAMLVAGMVAQYMHQNRSNDRSEE